MSIRFFDGTEEFELAAPGYQAGILAGDDAIRLAFADSWSADAFLTRHFPGREGLQRLRGLLGSQMPQMFRVDDQEVLRLMADMLVNGSLAMFRLPARPWLATRSPAADQPVTVVARATPASAAPERVEVAEPAPVAAPAKTFIEIELLDMQGRPVPGEAWIIILADGSEHRGTLDDQGLARVEGLDPGDCQVVFPYLDQRAVALYTGA
ncbi:hypothetical protein V0R50_08005 [Pseudomonas sp. 148P]|uniref:Uncharacterized protein n=1 Tax=Pseudomonas ulcerans TaxID=3115852 RepID=A0ABU7HNR8_9PSED|nr:MULTISPECIES: hypothetical protein [unclassified Pseudomonas]MEE1923663.1 hypothetical protein [Pseudomonas sp. 147P]MEE1933161.1 hypothetical protein [Pseudomonas sp. 148P]